MLLHLIGVVKLPELRPTCESFVLIDAINNGYNYNLVKKHIFNASTLNVTLCRYSICNHIKKSCFFNARINWWFQNICKWSVKWAQLQQRPGVFLTSSPRQTTFCGSQSSKNFHLPKKRYMYNMFHLPKKKSLTFQKKNPFPEKIQASSGSFQK